MDQQSVVLEGGERRNVATTNERGLKVLLDLLEKTHKRHLAEREAEYEPRPKDAPPYRKRLEQMLSSALNMRARYRAMNMFIPIKLTTMVDQLPLGLGAAR